MSGRDRNEQVDGCNDRLNLSDSPDARMRVLLRLDEVARLCGVSVKTVRRWVDGEGLPVIRIAGAGARPMTFVAPRDLDEWIDKRRRVDHPDEGDPRTVRLNGRRFINSDKSNERKSTGRP